MKNLILTQIFAIIFLVPFVLRANDVKYIEAMQKNIKAVYEAKDISGYQGAINGFERIASVEKTKWEPLYYIAFGNIMIANGQKEAAKKDAFLDLALEVINKARELAPKESEIIALEGFCYMMKIQVDPQSRGMIYAPKAMKAFEDALSLSPENPRALGLMAQMQFGTAQFFGSPATEACALNARASDSLASYKSENPLAPIWGKHMIESLKEKCK